ncbi:MAG: NDP-sugar synthase [Polyangiales bacterium]|nr:NDP-sugar synthase [Myxococcales bacterium]MCB9658724.1 NDP-sugar synthase [Sandaracinaceae bacterium]
MSGFVPITQAVVLGAGLGTRLRPMTNHLPKPGVPLLQRPVAAHAIDHLARAGVRTVAVNTHYLAPALEELLPHHLPDGVRLRFSREESLLGTGGGIRAAWGKLNPREPLIVMNGDIVFQPDLLAAIGTHDAHDALATMVVRAHPEAQRLGAIDTDAAGRVVRLLGTPAGRDVANEWMFTGVHVLSPAVFELLPPEGCVIRRGYRGWVDEGLRVYAVPSAAPFRDVGTHAEYLGAHLDALDVDAGVAQVHPEAQVHPSAVLTRSFVGAGARVGAGVVLRECVVWPGTLVTDSAERAIIGPFGVLAVR